ncbi:hypothetical protein [uncultured Cetobacterium sp.]|uniref:hypothetical protein n=1 Tax=uncultured Cetobacterium sp. TaxID=527638 RepID=UPI0025CE0443|nr:hypothetical protein [uncultured Cetobacterium sp.]
MRKLMMIFYLSTIVLAMTACTGRGSSSELVDKSGVISDTSGQTLRGIDAIEGHDQ